MREIRSLLTSHFCVLPWMIAACVVNAAETRPADPLDPYNVVWTSPSNDSSGSMPLGNGDIGLNVWTEGNGDVCFYISKTDAWDENCRLVKLGRVRISLSPNPFRTGQPFTQTLCLRQGEIEIRGRNNSSNAMMRIWVDANAPVVHVDITDDFDFTAFANLELWRTQERPLKGVELGSAYGMEGAPYPVVVTADTVVNVPTTTTAPAARNALIWYHRNRFSIWPETLKLQGMEAWIPQGSDPLLNRTFGAMMHGDNFEADSSRRLRSIRPTREQHLHLHVLTSQTATPDAWIDQLLRLDALNEGVPRDKARAGHMAWWDQFWNRSWIRVPAACQKDATVVAPMEENNLPLRIGADSNGQNQFLGAMDDVAVYGRALTAEEIGLHARGEVRPRDSEGCVGRWMFEGADDAALTGSVTPSLTLKKVGEVGIGREANRACAIFNGKGWLEIPVGPAVRLSRAVTLEARVRPAALPGGGGRIIDRSQAGTANGYLLDTHPGDSLRMIVAAGAIGFPAKLPADKWTHLAAVFDARTGEQTLYVNGKRVAGGPQQLGVASTDVTLGYTLQRFVTACAGRGVFPIKFNGSLFTVDARKPGETSDADYRRWGGPYWFQNTRLVYWPMLACGDVEMMQPLFAMYQNLLPFLKARTKLYFDHGGAFFPETMYFWGSYANANYGWDRTGKPPRHVDNTYIRWHYNGTLELLALMMDYYRYTGDEAFLRKTLLPMADEILAFWAQHFPREPNGRIVMKPAQALETYQNCVNPAPDVAGLRWVLPHLLELPPLVLGRDRRDHWGQLLRDMPEVPTTNVNGQHRLAPAENVIGGQGNIENPELYSIFPFRIFGTGRQGLELARQTFAARTTKANSGWAQDDTQAAMLGLAEEARRIVSGRFAQKDPGSRFPAFYGPNHDWVPDQDHGGNGMMALQSMLLQFDGRKLFVLPAWPRDWDVDFKLHAPLQTTVQGEFRGGKLVRLVVEPRGRLVDVVLPPKMKMEAAATQP